MVPSLRYSSSSAGSLSPSAISAAVPIETASAPSASALATSAPLRMPPETMSCTWRCKPRSCSAWTAGLMAPRIGRPTCSMNTSCVGAGLHRKRRVVIRARGADLDVDRLVPIGDLPEFLDFDLEVVGAGPVRMAAGRALIDAGGEGAHLGHAVGDFLPEQHAAAAGLGALTDHDLNGIGTPEIVGVHAVARGQDLVDEDRRMATLLLGHAAVAGGGRGSDLGRAAPQGLLGLGRERAEAHPGDGDGNFDVDGLLREARAEPHIGAAFLAIAFERVAAHRGAEKEEIVEMRHAS